MDSSAPGFRFTMDDAWLDELFEAQVAVLLPRWRSQRRLARVALLVGVPLLIGGAAWPSIPAAVLGAIGVASGLLSLRRQWLRRQRWLDDERRTHRHGAVVSVTLENGLLVQRIEGQDDVLGIPSGELRRGPNGWFVLYRVAHLGDRPSAPTTEVPGGVLYLPQRAMQPQLAPQAFEKLLPASLRGAV